MWKSISMYRIWYHWEAQISWSKWLLSTWCFWAYLNLNHIFSQLYKEFIWFSLSTSPPFTYYKISRICLCNAPRHWCGATLCSDWRSSFWRKGMPILKIIVWTKFLKTLFTYRPLKSSRNSNVCGNELSETSWHDSVHRAHRTCAC